MSLSETAQRIQDTLPAYYWREPLFQSLLQARANEIDRLDVLVDKLAIELQPGAATDDLGLLGIWEAQLDLPVRPDGATVSQRQDKLAAALQKLDSGSSADALATLTAAIGLDAYTVYRNTPTQLTDTLEIPFAEGSYNATIIQHIARKIWPAHRGLLMRYADGFLLDVSRLDADTF